MYTRHVILKLKADSASEFARITENEIVPRLHEQKGFRQQDTFISAGLSEAIVNSYWDTKEYAEAYNRTEYPEVLKALSKVVAGTPQVETFEISTATFHKIALKQREADGASNFKRG